MDFLQCIHKREWGTCMCVCSLICCSVAIVTTFPISLLIQTGLKLCLVAALPPPITIAPNMLPHPPQSSPPCPRSASSLNQALSSVSPVPILSLPDTVLTFNSLHSCNMSFFTVSDLVLND